MTRFSKLHPRVLLFYFVCILLLSCVSGNPIFVFLSLLGATAYSVCLRGRQGVKISLFLAVPLTLAVGLFNFLFAHWGVTVLFTIRETEFTLEALLYGFYQGMIFASVTLWMLLFGQVLSSDKLLSVTGKRAPNISLLFSMALGFFERFEKNARQIREARAGLNLPKKKPLQEAIEQFSILLTLSLEGSMTTADAMRARGYGKGKRKMYDRFTFCLWDGILLFIILGLFFTVLVLQLRGQVLFVFDPEIQLISLHPLGVAGAVLLSFLPAGMDIAENIKWQSLKQKA